MSSWSDKDQDIQRFVPWYDKYLPYCINKFFTTRSQHLGVRYLLWEVSLKMDEQWFGIYEDSTIDEIAKAHNDPKWMTPTHQAIAALEILERYCWWKFIRPMRPDPMDLSGFSDLFEQKRQREKELNPDAGIWELMMERTDDEREAFSAASLRNGEIEKQYDVEDTEMLIRLIKVRKNLWT